MAEFAGKIVLTYENSFAFACEAKRAGVLGVITIWHADLAHHERLEVYGEHLSRGSGLSLSENSACGNHKKCRKGIAEKTGRRSTDGMH